MPDFCAAVQAVLDTDQFFFDDAFRVSSLVESIAFRNSCWLRSSLNALEIESFEDWLLAYDRSPFPFNHLKSVAHACDDLSDKLRALPYKDFLRTNYWLSIKLKVLDIAEYRCQLCYSPDKLHVHHRTYDHRGAEFAFMGDLVALCAECHELFHRNKKLAKGIPRRASR